MATSSKIYVVDFKQIFSILSVSEVNEFYFYPGEIYGFIESCVLATQRDTDLESRQRYIVSDLMGAMDVWAQMEENQLAYTSGAWINGKSLDTYMVMKLAAPASAIDSFVYKTMSNLYETHGPLAISSKKFNWTPAKALTMEISY